MSSYLKNLQILAIFVAAATMVITPTDLQASSLGTAASGTGGRTGAPGDNGTCAVCHGGGSYGAVTAVISVDDMSGPVTGFESGVTYLLTVKVTNTTGSPSGYGFQATVLDNSDNFIGAFSSPSPGSGVASESSRLYWEQNSVSASDTFTILWTAPTTETTVTIYAVGVAVNGTGGTGGDSASPGASFSASLTLRADAIFADGLEQP